MVFMCKCFISVLILFLGILTVSRSLSDCLCIAPLTPVVMVMRGLTFQPVVLNVWMSGLYFVVFSLWVVFGNLSWQ